MKRFRLAYAFALIVFTLLAQPTSAETVQPPPSPNQAKAAFADSVYLTDSNYHRMMWVWQAEERARDIAKQRGLQGTERDQFIEKRVTEAKEQVSPQRLGDTPAGAIELDGAGLLPFPNYQKYYFGKLDDQLAKTLHPRLQREPAG